MDFIKKCLIILGIVIITNLTLVNSEFDFNNKGLPKLSGGLKECSEDNYIYKINFENNKIECREDVSSTSNVSGNLTDTSAYVNCTGDQVFLGNGSCWTSNDFFDNVDTTYTAGSNLSLVGTTFSLDVAEIVQYLNTLYQTVGDYLTTADESDLNVNSSDYWDGLDSPQATWTSTFNSTYDSKPDAKLTEDEVEAYIFDSDNTANLNMSNYNITGVDCIIFESGGKICTG